LVPDAGVMTMPTQGGCIVVFKGELDLTAAPELEDHLLRAVGLDGARVILDLGACEFVDSTGIALIVRAAERAAAGGGEQLRLVCNNGQVTRLLELTGADRAVQRFDTRDAALASLP
jgi:anti-sigma B factor antagonist